MFKDINFTVKFNIKEIIENSPAVTAILQSLMKKLSKQNLARIQIKMQQKHTRQIKVYLQQYNKSSVTFLFNKAIESIH